MGLTSDIDAAVIEAFDGDLNDAVKALSLVSITTIYDPTSGENEISEKITPSRGVLTTVEDSMVDGEIIQANDIQFTILQSELNATPTLVDVIRVGNVQYEINSIIPDPADVIWLLIGRSV